MATLKDVFENDFLVGAALNDDQVSGRDRSAAALVKEHFNSITPENLLKWEIVHPEPGVYEFGPADRYVEFGEENRMHIVGHTLVWHVQTPDWVFQDDSGRQLDRDSLLARMREHIHTVMGRYRARIQGWDVVNEAIDADGQLRKSKWFDIIGEDYILKAYEYAREADPDAELYYNDYNYEEPPKCQGIIRLVESLQASGIRLAGIGVQGHLFLDYPSTDDIESSFVALSKMGVNLMITELDVSALPFYPVDAKVLDISSFDPEDRKKYNPYPDALPDSAEKLLANRYGELFSLFHKHRDRFSRVTFWAVHDGQSWRSYMPISGRTDYPMLFDRQCKPKPAFAKVVDTILSEKQDR